MPAGTLWAHRWADRTTQGRESPRHRFEDADGTGPPCRLQVYYEDTDSLGVVYYANYLKFLERGRTEHLGARRRPIQAWNRDGYSFVVYELSMQFRRSARLGDQIDVVSTFKIDSTCRGRFSQRLERGGELLVRAEVNVVCVDGQQFPREFPPI